MHTIVGRLAVSSSLLFFFNATATTEIYTLSLHDALPISSGSAAISGCWWSTSHSSRPFITPILPIDRKSTRLNSSHANISYAVFCLKKKKRSQHTPRICQSSLYVMAQRRRAHHSPLVTTD